MDTLVHIIARCLRTDGWAVSLPGPGTLVVSQVQTCHGLLDCRVRVDEALQQATFVAHYPLSVRTHRRDALACYIGQANDSAQGEHRVLSWEDHALACRGVLRVAAVPLAARYPYVQRHASLMVDRCLSGLDNALLDLAPLLYGEDPVYMALAYVPLAKSVERAIHDASLALDKRYREQSGGGD